MSSLREKTISGVLWSAIESLSVQGVRFIVTLLMARLLMPSDFGIIGMLSIFMAISQTFIDSGFSNALIQKKNRTETDFSTTFYFNIGIGILFYFLLFFFAPLISKFYNTPHLTTVTRVLAINLIISSLSLVPRTNLLINIDFKTQAKVSWISALIGGIVGIIMAYRGYGVWALVCQNILNNLLTTFFLFSYTKWMPKKIFSKNSFNELFGFGSKLLVAGLIYTLFENIYLVIIGKFYNSNILGYYVKAKNISNLPSANITSIVQRVTFPILSSIQNDDDKLKTSFKKLVRLVSFFVFPLVLALSVIAHPLIKVLLTDKWSPAAPLLQLLCIAMVWYPINELNVNMLKVKGKASLILNLEIIKKIVAIILILVTLPIGLYALLVGQIISSFITLMISMYFAGKIIGYNIKNQLSDIIPHLLIALIVGGITYYIIEYISFDSLKILFALINYSGIYIAISCLFKSEELKEGLKIVKWVASDLVFADKYNH